MSAAWDERDPNTWLPIETAPRDGTIIFGCSWKMGQRGMVSFNGREWEMVDGLTNLPMGIGFYPSHWFAIPPQPDGPVSATRQDFKRNWT